MRKSSKGQAQLCFNDFIMIIEINISTNIFTIRPGMIVLLVIINQGLDPGQKSLVVMACSDDVMAYPTIYF